MVKEINIPSKIYTVESLHKVIASQIEEISVVIEGKSLKFTDGLRGVGFNLTGSALTSLGYANQKVVVKSKRITPPWSLVKRLNGYDLLFSKELSLKAC